MKRAGDDGVRATYDAIARDYDREVGGELAHKPLDRALLTAFVEQVASAAGGRIADVGCGPGHVTRFLAGLHDDVVGVDLSPEMVAVASSRAPNLSFTAASMLDLPVADGEWAGAVLFYSVIHLQAADRRKAFAEVARVLRPGAPLLVSFHVSDAEQPAGSTKHLTTWFGHEVDVSVGFLDPDAVAADLDDAGFGLTATVRREPHAGVEYPSRRCYLLATRR